LRTGDGGQQFLDAGRLDEILIQTQLREIVEDVARGFGAGGVRCECGHVVVGGAGVDGGINFCVHGGLLEVGSVMGSIRRSGAVARRSRVQAGGSSSAVCDPHLQPRDLAVGADGILDSSG
jgi:hypothetical protein